MKKSENINKKEKGILEYLRFRLLFFVLLWLWSSIISCSVILQIL